MEILELGKVNILKEDVVCTFKTCRKVNPSKQHWGRRHTDVPYLRRVNGKVAKFVRSGVVGDEERPFQCCCGKEYHNTRSLADHLTNSCNSFHVEMQLQTEDTIKMRNITCETTSSSSSSSSDDYKYTSSEQTENVLSTSALLSRIIELESRVNYLERNSNPCQRCIHVGANQVHHENRNMEGSYGYDPFNNNNGYDQGYNNGDVVYPEIQTFENTSNCGVECNNGLPPAFPQDVHPLPSISDLFQNIHQKNYWKS